MKKKNLNTDVTFFKNLKELLDKHETNFNGNPYFKRLKDTQRFMSLISVLENWKGK